MKRMDRSEEVEKTLSSLDHVMRSEVNPNFETELYQKVSFLPQTRVFRWLSYSAAAVILLTMVNIWAVTFSSRELQKDRETYFEVLSDDFLYQSTNYIEIE